MKEILKSSIQLNLNYQLIFLVKSIHLHYQRINQSKQKAQKTNFFYLGFSLSENPSRLSENLLA